MSGWDDPKWKEYEKKMQPIRALFGPVKLQAVAVFEDSQYYPAEQIREMILLQREIENETAIEDVPEKVNRFQKLLEKAKAEKKAEHFEKIYLWKEGNMPQLPDYTENAEYRYNHNPDFIPYMYECLLPEDVTPKGAVIVCAGGDHGDAAVLEGWQVCLELNQLGYQCFHLLNRTNHMPWTKQEAGVDMARAVRYVRQNHGKYRVGEHQITIAGFSNGGVTCESCIEFYSGEQRVKDAFPEYAEDELDTISATPDAFLCVYGPRFAGAPFDYEGVVYPPVFFAVGREDGAMENLNAVYPDLLAHGVQVEVHTFAGVPHGQAGMEFLGREKDYPNFTLWQLLADSFMQDVYRNL